MVGGALLHRLRLFPLHTNPSVSEFSRREAGTEGQPPLPGALNGQIIKPRDQR